MIFVLLILVLAGLYFLKKKEHVSSSDTINREFAVKNPEEVKLIFMTDQSGDHQIFLRKQDDGSWTVNDSFPADQKKVDFLLFETMSNLKIQGPAPKAAVENIISYMSINGIKVEVYSNDLNKPEMVYTVGNTTPTQLGTYYKLPGDDLPMIVHIPGFNGFLNIRYELMEDEWISPRVFGSTKEQIQEIEVTYPNADDSYKMVKGADGNIDFTANGITPSNLNSGAVKSYFNLFEKLNYETFVFTTSDSLKDSLLNATPFCIIRVKSTNRGTDELKLYHKPSHDKMHGLFDKDGNKLAHDPSRFYALYNKLDRVLIAQDYTFGKVLQTADKFKLRTQ